MKKVCWRAASQWRVVEVAVGTSRALGAELSAGCSRPRSPYTCAVCNRTLARHTAGGTEQAVSQRHHAGYEGRTCRYFILDLTAHRRVRAPLKFPNDRLLRMPIPRGRAQTFVGGALEAV